MATTIPTNIAQVEQKHQQGDSYSMTLRRTGFSFTAYTCTAVLYDAKKATILELDIAKSGTNDDTLTATATSSQMSIPCGVYYMQWRIESEDVVKTLLYNKITVIDKPTW